MGHEAHNKCLHGYMNIRFRLAFIEAILLVSRIVSPQKRNINENIVLPPKRMKFSKK